MVLYYCGLELEPTGEAVEREAKEQLVTVNRRVDKKGKNSWRDIHKTKGRRDFLKDLCPSMGFTSSNLTSYS